jgi:SRSO17 transposase
MLPECRSVETFSIPKFDLVKEDYEGLIDELGTFQSHFHDCFSRSETRENFFQYAVGQLSHLDRKSIEPMALNVEGGKVRPLQRFISGANWQDDKIGSIFRSMVNDDIGDESGVLIFDESGFVKKGEDSAGVSRQYCGSIGKVENSQIGVFAAYASKLGYTLIDNELYIPEKWFDDEHREKREKCEFPENLGFKTKPQLAAEMLKKIQSEGILPFSYVAADSVYGENPDFISAIEENTGLIYFVSVGKDTKFWIRQPIVAKKTSKQKGEAVTKTVLTKGSAKAITANDFAKNLNDYFWYKRKVSEGTKGPIEYEFTKKRIVLSKKGLPDKNVWLIIKRSMEEKPQYSFFISNAPVSSRLKLFVWLSGVRWAIEQCFAETKKELGLDQYEVRKYMGWYHHILMTMLSHFFLWHIKIRLGKKNTFAYYSSN